MTFSSHCFLANEAGETPLDIAKRLKHTRCEELVRFIFFFCVFSKAELFLDYLAACHEVSVVVKNGGKFVNKYLFELTS